jgi:hypothetical protein
MSNRIPRLTTDIKRLSHDNVMSGEFGMLLDGGVIHFSEQAWHEEQRQHIAIPRKVFDAFVDWYTTGKVPPGDRAARTPPKETANAQ